LGELGWTDGRTVAIVFRWAEGRGERATDVIAEFVRTKVDLIVTSGTSNVTAAKRATSTIPIIFASAADPVGNGLVASLARPNGNLTGLSSQSADLGSKKLEILREVVPGLRRLAVLTTSDNTAELSDLNAAATTLGLAVAVFEIRKADDIAPAFDAFKGRVEALYVTAHPLMTTNQIRINILAAGAHLPTIYSFRDQVESGGLLSYGADFVAQYRRAADYVDRVLRGTKPADLPVEQPIRFDLVVNLTTAKAIGLTIPETFLVRADEVIE
jgi:putative ABC transport system substrate-binding protein